MLNGLDLFSGIGGLSLALEPWVKTIAYCESDPFACAVLLSRMANGVLHLAPIWDEVRTLQYSMLPHVDIIFGGFPCQNISVAGNGDGLGGKQSSLVFQAIRLISDIKPCFIFLENVPAIRTRGAADICARLACLGYDTRFDLLSVEEMGAPHRRSRWFLLAANSDSIKLWDESRRSGRKGWENTPQPKLPGPYEWCNDQPDFCRVDDGFPEDVDRLRTLGNAVVPIQAREAFRRLMGIPRE